MRPTDIRRTGPIMHREATAAILECEQSQKIKPNEFAALHFMCEAAFLCFILTIPQRMRKCMEICQNLIGGTGISCVKAAWIRI